MIEELYKRIEQGDSLNEIFLFLRDNKNKFSKEDEQMITECPKSAICICNLIFNLLDGYELKEK